MNQLSSVARDLLVLRTVIHESSENFHENQESILLAVDMNMFFKLGLHCKCFQDLSRVAGYYKLNATLFNLRAMLIFLH